MEYLTPHQFERLQPFIDTLAVAACHPDPLDVAVPTGAARWISEMVLARVKDRFRGRVAERLLGTGLTWRGLDAEFLQALSAGCGFPVRFGVVVCDRALLSDCCAITAGPSEWLVVDWWQWFRSRAPRERLPDLWLYLSLAHAPYRHSEEWRALGLSAQTADEMAAEGNRLLNVLVAWLAERVERLWAGASVPGLRP